MSELASAPPYVFSQTGTFPAPFEFDVPASLAIRPDTAHATFDGTGAGGDFLACLAFYDSNGNLLCRMFNPTPVTAGNIAEVTFVPPFGSAASGSSSTTSIGFASYSGSLTPLPTSSVTHFEWAWDGTAGQEDMFDLTVNDAQPIARRAGFYFISYTATVFHVGALTGTLALTMDVNSSVGGSSFANASFPLEYNAATNRPGGEIFSAWPLQAGDFWDNAVAQDSGGGLNVSAAFYAVRISVS